MDRTKDNEFPSSSILHANKRLLELDLDFLERRGGNTITYEGAEGGSKEEDSPADTLDRVKVIFLGAPGVGKTSIIRQFVWSEFSEEYRPTERRETFYPSVVLADRLYELKITDLPTIPYFPVSSHLEWTDFRYYGLRSATAYVLVFDLSNQDTFQYIRTLREQIYEARDMRGVPLLVVGNKQDELSQTVASGTSYRDIVNLVRKHWRCGYVECSARFNCRVVQIVYRGLTIPEVIALLPREGNSPSAEAVFWLLLTGDVPTQQQTASLIADWTSRRKKCTEWWSGPRGETIASVLRSMPETITPLHRLSVALTIFDVSKQAKEAKRHGAMPYTYWEYTYEDGMEFLATLPAIIGLIARGQTLTNVSGDGDWTQFLLDCLNNESFDGRKSSIADFLRLYITLNADDDGGAPIAHVTQILGLTDLHINEVLASSVLAHIDEPKSGTMFEWKELQTKIKNTLGRTWTEHALKTCVLNLWSRDKLTGHREADFCDPRYTALLHYAKQYLSDNSEVKLSQDITRILRSTMGRPKRKEVYPEQNALAPVIFQYYGLEDMRLNQTILYMARALGAIASIIWTTVVNAPVEHPISRCTHSYIETIRDDNAKKRKGRRTRK
ncbi:probable citrate synthase 2, mitochondrial isoform X2 [Temnothorax nylanderi]|uniref:probable citrate synthase 2, mitochondrial isoform X2 n=1 Tax=Temnothorax nylanderi TaxID=102681 RepID=UPI003A8C0AE5